MEKSKKTFLLKIIALVFSFSLMIFYVIFQQNVKALMQGSKATFRDGRPFREMQDMGSYDEQPDLRSSQSKPSESENLLLSIVIDEKETLLLNEGKLPKFSEENQKKIEEKIGKIPESVSLIKKEDSLWEITVEEKRFILKKEQEHLHFYATIPISSTPENKK